MSAIEKVQEIVIPMVAREFVERTPKGATTETLKTIHESKFNLVYNIFLNLQENPELDPAKVTKKELKFFFED